MAEVSEKERKRRKYVVRDGDYNIAFSFRLEPEYRDRLKMLAKFHDKSQADMFRKMIDVAYNHMTKAQKQKSPN